ncbi:hypothetical protein A3I99_00615 [Candidatus Kaiserbacteria bacterium RIFCSPLOWO2_02_FULL_45_11b]|uniref:Uncharacterized protein n=1 Tax=Candidatus Kaiserbacteria bacterium RIFCSPLOWO2_12_FULL_45_26 TaxID=1798525 RepID=A0A1F6FG97_9BACT|nr:MAG: hypothetical protein A2929_01025 [Candidatus Kaiserbacteria bacterium RIFCSPLOWO2_01_FULL_45_25]OGG84276.1 MAG: hypothetical protein A3I99_00615 [Candidatus Kaiserbacteria bacterium RIFCSPLOWO2_02_FULL_45_11b]OGG84871.1 MAG: hypothetical protein A3G90_02220 [Candidatus Kaiserbacteria bacterium RIFCSPLOWO2_12_FULL_45_26]
MSAQKATVSLSTPPGESLMELVKVSSPVSRVRKFVSRVHWPSRRQVAKRGCDPYVEFDIRGRTYRAHFIATADMKTERTHSVYVTAQGPNIKVSSIDDSGLQVGKVFVVYEDPFALLKYA